MIKELFLSIAITCCGGLAALSSFDDHNAATPITTPVKRANTYQVENFTQFQAGVYYEFDIVSFATTLLGREKLPVSSTPVNLFTFSAPYVNTNNFQCIAFVPSFDDYEVTDGFYLYYTYSNDSYYFTLGYDSDDVDLFTIDSNWSVYLLLHEYLAFSPSFNYRPSQDVNHPEFTRDDVALQVVDTYSLNWRSHLRTIREHYFITNSSFALLDWNRIAQLVNNRYKDYQHLVIKGLWTRADKDTQTMQNFFYKNQIYKELHVWKYKKFGITQFAVQVLSTNDKYSKIYVDEVLGLGTSTLQILNPMYMDMNLCNLEYGYNYSYLANLSPYTPIVEDVSFNDLAFTLVDTPLYTMFALFNIDLFGVNMFALVTGLLTAILIIWLIRKFI